MEISFLFREDIRFFLTPFLGDLVGVDLFRSGDGDLDLLFVSFLELYIFNKFPTVDRKEDLDFCFSVMFLTFDSLPISLLGEALGDESSRRVRFLDSLSLFIGFASGVDSFRLFPFWLLSATLKFDTTTIGRGFLLGDDDL